MTLENVVVAVSLLLGIVLLILIIYLISRVNDLEAKAFSTLASLPSGSTANSDSRQVFAGLSGRDLWDQWVSIANGGEDEFDILGDRDRFLALLELHVRSLIKTGIEHGSNGTTDPPANPLKIKMLRGEFESYIPSSQAGRLYELGNELGATENNEQGSLLVADIRDTVDAISMGIDAGSSFVEAAMRDVEYPSQNQEVDSDISLTEEQETSL